MSDGDSLGARATLTQRVVDGGLVLRVDGELDMATVAGMCAALSAATAAMAPPSILVLDISAVDFLAASGVHMLRGIMTSCASQGVRTCLVIDSGSLAQSLLRMVALSDNIRVFASVGEALDAKV